MRELSVCRDDISSRHTDNCAETCKYLCVAGRRGVRAAVLAAAMFGAVVGVGALSSSAAAQSACGFSATMGPNPAYTDQLVAVSVSAPGGSCGGQLFIVRSGSGQQLCSGALVFGNTSGACGFRAVTGLGEISVSLGRQERLLGTLIVMNRQPPPPPPSSPHPTATQPGGIKTVTKTANPTATPTGPTSVPRVKIPPPTHPDPHYKSSSAGPDPYPWHPAPGPTAPPSSAEPGASVSAVAVVTSAHGGGANPIPLGLLIGALVILGGLVVAATRLVTTHVRAEAGS